MSNRNIVMDENGNVIGEYYASLVCCAIVRTLVEKYNADRIVDFTCCPNTINDGPKKHLIFMRELLGKHQSVETKYMDSTIAMTVTSA